MANTGAVTQAIVGPWKPSRSAVERMSLRPGAASALGLTELVNLRYVRNGHEPLTVGVTLRTRAFRLLLVPESPWSFRERCPRTGTPSTLPQFFRNGVAEAR